MEAFESTETELIKLSPEDQEAFTLLLLNPPELSPGMQRAMADHERLIEANREPRGYSPSQVLFFWIIAVTMLATFANGFLFMEMHIIEPTLIVIMAAGGVFASSVAMIYFADRFDRLKRGRVPALLTLFGIFGIWIGILIAAAILAFR